MLTILVTSARVAPGLLSWPAWDALRAASRVLVGSADHPQVPALVSAGVVPEVVDMPADAAGLAAILLEATRAGAESVVWLAPAGSPAPGELLDALSAFFGGRVRGGTARGGTAQGGTARSGTARSGATGGDAVGGDAAGNVRVLDGSRDLPGAHLLDVVATMETLRISCPWDRQQTHETLATHLLEEPYEALEALENGDHQALREELGDVLMQVVFHARIAAERPATEDGYTIDDVADVLVAKLVRRHPHVFGGVAVGSADEVISNWDAIKKAERAAKQAGSTGAAGAPQAPPSALDGVVLGQPALSLAAQVLRRAARAGFPEVGDGVRDSAAGDPSRGVDRGVVPPGARGDDPPGAGELGDELFRLVARAAELRVDPELELRAAVRRVIARVRDWELKQR